MNNPTHTDVLIIGAGPAGISTALHLLQTDPNWAGRMAVVDKATHPREKLCGGGVTRTGEAVLTNLGLPFEAEHVFIKELHFVYRGSAYALYDDPVFRITRRADFDHWLAQQAEKRGATLYQGEAVTDVIPHRDGVEVITQKQTFHAKSVVVADGSNSFVRKKLKWPGGKHKARLLEVLTPENAQNSIAHQNGVAVFDFSALPENLQGYYWDFPELINGQAMMNRGVFDSRTAAQRPHAALKDILRSSMAARGRRLEDVPLKGHPIHCFDPHGQLAMPRIILAGDAAGVDPVVGEGIAFALQYGAVAAAALSDAFQRNDFSFAAYKTRVQRDPLLGRLNTRVKLARLVYGFKYKWQFDMAWKLLPALVRFLAWIRPQSMPFKSPRLVKKDPKGFRNL
jgi:geranylgeranyl reductase family protein